MPIPLNSIELKSLRSDLSTIPVEAILVQKTKPEVLDIVDKIVRKRIATHRINFGVILPYDIATKWLGTNAWMDIRKYCDSRLSDDIVAPPYLLEVLIEAYKPEKAGAWVANHALRDREPKLEFDDDDLLIGPQADLQFTKEGVLTQKHFILYDFQLPGINLSGGFVDFLLSCRRTREPKYFGLAVSDACLLAREYHRECFTKAYIRGPKGLSPQILQDPHFPECPSGTVTVHKRLDSDPLLQLFPLDRIEIMWSSRDGQKTVQIEELVPLNGLKINDGEQIRNRYIHSIWDPSTKSFVHLDGAVRSYDKNQYQKRLGTNLKRLQEKRMGYKKLFRIDAPIDITIWSDLVSRFFFQNELILEYLGGPKEIGNF